MSFADVINVDHRIFQDGSTWSTWAANSSSSAGRSRLLQGLLAHFWSGRERRSSGGHDPAGYISTAKKIPSGKNTKNYG
jgi:hypothetical protein